jgi:Pyridoxamine 5'-phosphate oxidase
MGPAEVNAFLAEQRTCRVATASELGPHLTPLWYLWDGTALWLTSIVSSQPRTGLPEPRLDEPERLSARKYAGGDVMHHDGRHAWLRLLPDKVASWDFRILYQAQN